LVYDLISGLSALHKADICHNDIRPDNVFYSTSNKCYVIGNFSYATKNATMGNLRNNRASKNYVSPEANTNEQFDFRKADVYSLGATLLCALYLCNPIDVQ
jgi:serine/threonine protein kinase